MDIRGFRPGEEEALCQVFRSSVRALTGGHYTPEQRQAWASAPAPALQDRIAALRPWVVESEGVIAAYADLQNDGYIDHFFVSERFARLGIGSALMRHLLALGRKRGLERLYADVSLNAQPFFARHGFTVRTRRQVTVAGIALENARMDHALDSGNGPQ